MSDDVPPSGSGSPAPDVSSDGASAAPSATPESAEETPPADASMTRTMAEGLLSEEIERGDGEGRRSGDAVRDRLSAAPDHIPTEPSGNAAEWDDAGDSTQTGAGSPWRQDLRRIQGDIGQTVGPYRLVRIIGRGGMGTVYLAERNDGQFEQQVALKITRHDLSPQAQQRFLAERQILAQLHHPNIAQLLDGGVTSDGRPYLVMEYVDGTPLTRYCDEHRLGVGVRLQLFQQVCDAVQFAHRNLVIHRDIKPSNIIVTQRKTTRMDTEGSGLHVKLLDFGVAKALDGAATDAPRTRTGEAPMTPAYAAPEQLDGMPVTTATDVYALGVVLCELLSGLLPYDVMNRSIGQVARIITEQVPIRPSARIRDREGRPPVEDTHGLSMPMLERRLVGDLDIIVLKCLRKEPEQRYASPVDLAQDIERHLTDQPVEARAITTGYRFRRFVRRNRTAVLVGVAAMAAIVMGLSMAIWQAGVAAEERDRAQLAAEQAERQGARAQAVQRFLFDMIDRAAPSGDVTIQQVLAEADAELERSMHDQPELNIEIRSKLGIMYRLLGETDASIQQTARAFDMGMDKLGPTHPQTFYASWQYGTALMRAGQMTRADSVLGVSVERLRASGGPPIAHAGLLSTHGELLVRQARLDTAQATLEAARDWYDRRVTPDTSQITGIWSALGAVHRRKGDLDAAQAAYEEALRFAEASEEDDSRSAIADVTNNLANVYRMRGEFSKAEESYRRSMHMQSELFGERSPRTATVMVNLSRSLRAQGKLDEADPLSKSALAIFQDLLPPSDYRVGVVMGLRSDVLVDLGRLDEAEAILTEARRIVHDGLGANHPRTASMEYRLGTLYFRKAEGRARTARVDPSSVRRAETHLTTALETYRAAHGSSHPSVSRTKSLLGAVYTTAGRFEEAESLLTASYAAQTSPPERLERDSTRERLVTLYTDWGRADAAREWQEKDPSEAGAIRSND